MGEIMEKIIFRKTIRVMLIVILILSLPGVSLVGAKSRRIKIRISRAVKNKIDSGDVIISKKAFSGVKVKIVKNPQDKEAGQALSIDMPIDTIAKTGAQFSAWKIIKQNMEMEKKYPEIAKEKGFGNSKIRKELGEESAIDLLSDILIEEGIGVSLSDVEYFLDDKNSLLDKGVKAGEMILVGKIEKKIPLVGTLIEMPLLTWDMVPEIMESLFWAKYSGERAVEGIGWLVDYYVFGKCNDCGDNGGTQNFVTNPIDSAPQKISFTETFSGYNSATPDYPGSPSSTLTFSGLAGERTGIFPALLIQNMHGRFEGYGGIANTLKNWPINGYIKGNGILVNGRPITCQAQLSMFGIGDFESALGPFTINADGTSYGTFTGYTFDILNPDVITGDVVLYYTAKPQ